MHIKGGFIPLIYTFIIITEMRARGYSFFYTKLERVKNQKKKPSFRKGGRNFDFALKKKKKTVRTET
jgi:hypothetical protein